MKFLGNVAPFRKLLRLAGLAGMGFVALSVVGTNALRIAVEVSENRRRKTAPKCSVCRGQCTGPCRVCQSTGVIDWSPLARPVIRRPVLCPTCDGAKVQKCLNCLGKGFV